MELIILIARPVLAAVLIVAGIAKFVGRARIRQSLSEFGVPDDRISLVSWLLPIVEFAVGLTLLCSITAWWGAVGAFTLFNLFNAVIGYNLIRGRKPNCNCFGQLHSSAIGGQTLLRNFVFTAIAAFIVIGADTSRGINWSGIEKALIISWILATMVLGLILWLLAQLLKQQGEILGQFAQLQEVLQEDAPRTLRPHEEAALSSAPLPIGAPAPDFALPNLDGQQISLKDVLASERPTLLFFMSADCGPCAALIPEIHRWHNQHANRASFVIISKGAAGVNRAKFAHLGIDQVLLHENSGIAEEYAAKWTPAAVLIKPDRAIASHVAFGDREIKSLVEHFVKFGVSNPWFSALGTTNNGHSKHAPELPKLMIGAPAPTFALPDLDGRQTNLVDYRGRKTLLLFWNMKCGFCQEIIPDLQNWEQQRTSDSPQLLVISSGEAEEHREMKLKSSVLLDQDLKINKAFGAPGTPSAILIDENGHIASILGSGIVEVFALAGYRKRHI